jgi:hypothetical protein
MRRTWLVALVGVGVLAAAGCGSSNRGAVKGKVTVNGSPLEAGDISFVPIDASLGPTAGAVITNGEYAIAAARGPVAGEYVVRINAFGKTGKKIWDGMGDDKAPDSQKNFVEEVKPLIPPRYNDQSELRAKIEAGKVNVCDYALKIDPQR